MLLDSLTYLLSHPIRCIATLIGLVAALIALGYWAGRPDNNTDQP